MTCGEEGGKHEESLEVCACVRVYVRRVELGKHCGWINRAAALIPRA